MCKVLVVHYSMYGHIYRMAEAVAEGVRQVAGCEATVKRVPETLPEDRSQSIIVEGCPCPRCATTRTQKGGKRCKSKSLAPVAGTA